MPKNRYKTNLPKPKKQNILAQNTKMCQSTFLLSNMPKQLFSKTFSHFLFAIFLVGSLFGLLGIGKVEVLAAAEEGYFVGNCTSAICQAGKFTECRKIDGGTGTNSFCQTSTDGSLRKTFLVAGCTTAGTCKDGAQEYTGCNVSGSCTGAPAGVVANGSNIKLTSEGITCEVNPGSGSIGDCNKGTEKINGNIVCATYNTNVNYNLSCKIGALTFSKEETGGTFWQGDGVYVFKDSNGKSVPVNADVVKDVCNTAQGLAGWIKNTSPALLIIQGLGNIAQRAQGDEFNCAGQETFASFKQKIQSRGVKSDIVSSSEGIKLIAKSKIDITSCTIATGADLEKEKITPKTGETWKNCSGKIILDTAEGFIDKSGTKFDAKGNLLTGTTATQGDGSIGGRVGASVIDGVGDGLGKLFNIILTIISFIILALTYFAGWLAIGALWILGYLFLIFLRINPAGANFIAVAVDPWRIVVGIANMFVLSTFIFVGFGYILDIAKLKVKIEDFLLKIIVFTLILNFTLLGSASIVNVTQGIGEIMVGAYSIGETDPQKANFALINGLIEGMSRASVLRCGNLEWALDGNDKPSSKPAPAALKPGETAPPSASESATGKDCDWGGFGIGGQVTKLGTTYAGGLTGLIGVNNLRVNGKAGSIVSITIMELVFLAIAVFAVIQFWKALALVLGRTIGLWLLIVASPLALAAYISPIEGLKKYASQWLDHFWKWCLFYPSFIFCLILINIMSRSFSDAASAQVNNLASNSSGIMTNAAGFQIGGVDAINLMLFAILGVVPMFLLSVTVDYFAKSFEAIAKMTLGAAKNAWTGFQGAATTVGGLVSGGATALGNKIDKSDFDLGGRLKGGVTWRKAEANRATDIQKDIKKQQDIIDNKLNKSSSSDITKAKEEKEKLITAKSVAETNSKARFTMGLDQVAKGGDAIAMAPSAAAYALSQAKYNMWDRFATGNKATQAYYKEKLEGEAELRARAKATPDQARELDKNPLMRRFKGVGKEGIDKNGMKYYQDLVRGNADQASQAVWGTDKINMSQQTGLDRAKKFLEESGEDYANYTPEQKQSMRELFVLASKNGAVRALLMNNKKGKDALRFFQDELTQEIDGQKAVDELLKEFPDANKESAQFAIGKEIGSRIAANPNDPTIPKNITEEKILEGIRATISDPNEVKKRYGSRIYNNDDLSNAFYSNKNSGNANLQTTEDQMSLLQNTAGIVNKAQFTQAANVKNSIIGRIKEKLVANGSITDAEVQIIKDQETEKGYKNEFGTNKIGEENFDQAVNEIFATFNDPNDEGKSLLKTGLGKKLASSGGIKQLLESGDDAKIKEGRKLVAQGLAGALKAANIRQPLFNDTMADNAKLYAEGQYRGEQAAVAPSLEWAQIKKTRSAAKTPEELRAIVAADDSEALRNTFGTSDVTESIREGVATGKRIDADLGLVDKDLFVKLGSIAERNTTFTKITNAISEAANKGINDDGAGNYSFRDSSAITALNSGANPIDINQGELAKKIANKGQYAVQQVLQNDDVGAALDARTSKSLTRISDIHKGTMYDANVADENFVNSSGSASPSVSPNLNTTTQSIPLPPPPPTPVNNIVDFRREAGNYNSGDIRGIADNLGVYLVNKNGEYVDRLGNIIADQKPVYVVDSSTVLTVPTP